MRASLEAVLLGLREARVARRLRAMEAVFAHPPAARRRAQEARRARLGAFLGDLAKVAAERRPAPRAGAPDVLGILGLGAADDAHAALLAWALDPEGEHGLGDAFARAVLDGLGVAVDVAGGRYRVKREGAAVFVVGRARTVALALGPAAVGRATERARPVMVVAHAALERAITDLAPRAPAEARWLLEAWAGAVRRCLLGRTTMTEWNGFSPDVKFLLEHWEEYLDVVAVREQLDREFDQCRQRVLAKVVERYPADQGWDATLDEDWVLLRRKTWPVPREEWLAFVVVLTDVEATMTEGSDGWWSALSLPTDGEFDADTFSTLVRGRLDPVAWRAHLATRWPGYVVGRHLPRVDGRAVLMGEIERIALDELARYVQLVPLVDQALRDIGLTRDG